MSGQQHAVILNHGVLDVTPQEELIFRGVLNPSSLMLLIAGEYQRDVLPLSTIMALKEAMDKGSVPDVELGMRGANYTEPTPGCIHLADKVYIIDGLQRITAAIEKLSRGEAVPPHLGAVVHLDTTETWERERFRILNMERTKLSPNVLLRNWHNDYRVMDLLLELNSDKNFIMKGRVSWRQNMRREELITALTLCKIAGRLHNHLGPAGSSRIDELVPGLQKIYDKVGPRTFKDNIKRFFEVVDIAWGIKRIAFKEGAVYIRSNFLTTLARVFSGHLDFWEDNRFVVDRSIVSKLGLFSYNDPTIAQLATGNSKAMELLYILMRDHINSGKRTKRLRPRYQEESAPMRVEDNPEEIDDTDN